ncbi:MAG TPA: hypothetical protein VGX92_21810 [Pyrinomonadaceae bacterium]|jgi:hypothetical protein|nr:hypothetical protein [Pyrinomonadaceae bacterium]
MVEEEIEVNRAGDGGATSGGQARLRSDAARARLTHLLIGKAIVETLFVAALTIAFYFTAFPTDYRGWGEATARGIEGWAVKESAVWDRVEVQLFIDGRFVTARTANLSRPDVQKAGYARDEWHGYAFELPPLPAGEHEARVYALHGSGAGARYTLQLLGKPIRFQISESNAVTSTDDNPR